MNLTTTSRYKAYMGITGTALDTLIAAMLPLVSDEIERYLQRNLELAIRKSWVDGLGGPVLRMENWPILALYSVAVGGNTVARIENDGTATRATVSFDGTNVVLTSVSAAGAETITELPVATYKVLSTLKTAVDALSAAGWSMTISSSLYDNEPTAQLRPIHAMDATGTADLQVPDDFRDVKQISTDAIEQADGGNFPTGSKNIFIWYKAGYILPTDGSAGTMPPALELVVFQILQDVIAGRQRSGDLQSESLGDYSYSRGAVVSALESRKKDLNQFRRVTL